MVLVVDFRVSSLIHVDIIIKDFSEALVSVSTCLRSRASMSLTGLVWSSIGSVTSMMDSHVSCEIQFYSCARNRYNWIPVNFSSVFRWKELIYYDLDDVLSLIEGGAMLSLDGAKVEVLNFCILLDSNIKVFLEVD